MDPMSPISISIVSHKQALIVKRLLMDLQKYCPRGIEVLLTINVSEKMPFDQQDFNFPLHLIGNDRPRGFSSNHNAAFQLSKHIFFCVMNPDIRLRSNPFPTLLACFENRLTGAVAPLIVDPACKIEDSARRFPTPFSILKKALKINVKKDYDFPSEPFCPDWIAGMFMLLSRDRFREMGGFDEKYFLYYEDVDLCARLYLAGYQNILCPSVSVVHEAQRASHKKLSYLKWHIWSFLRFFLSKVFFNVAVKKIRNKERG
jgi:GT2 family glycosyltransferase